MADKALDEQKIIDRIRQGQRLVERGIANRDKIAVRIRRLRVGLTRAALAAAPSAFHAWSAHANPLPPPAPVEPLTVAVRAAGYGMRPPAFAATVPAPPAEAQARPAQVLRVDHAPPATPTSTAAPEFWMRNYQAHLDKAVAARPPLFDTLHARPGTGDYSEMPPPPRMSYLEMSPDQPTPRAPLAPAGAGYYELGHPPVTPAVEETPFGRAPEPPLPPAPEIRPAPLQELHGRHEHPAPPEPAVNG